MSPARRKALYAALAAAGAVLVAAGVVTEDVAANWTALIDNVLGVVALGLAAYKTRRVDYTALYGVLAAVSGSLAVVGLITDGQSAKILEVLAAATYALPLIVAAIRTSAATPTGEPVAEYRARHSG